MRAMVLDRQHSPLRLEEIPAATPRTGEVRLRISACAVCRTDLHILDGELAEPLLPLVLGHQIVGRVVEVGDAVTTPKVGDRVGVPWLGYVDGSCDQCHAGRENLCRNALFTGYTMNGGYADEVVARAAACLQLPEEYSDVDVAPLLCAGLIGYRAYRFTGDGPRLGIYGFGSAAHILTQVAVHQGRDVYAFTRDGDDATQRFAIDLGAAWAGSSLEPPPVPLDAAIIFAPVGALAPVALRAVGPGGIVVCGGIHMTDIPGFPYAALWEERVLRSVANLTHGDGLAFLELAPRVPVRTEVEVMPLAAANEALQRVRDGGIQGSVVLSLA